MTDSANLIDDFASRFFGSSAGALASGASM